MAIYHYTVREKHVFFLICYFPFACLFLLSRALFSPALSGPRACPKPPEPRPSPDYVPAQPHPLSLCPLRSHPPPPIALVRPVRQASTPTTLARCTWSWRTRTLPRERIRCSSSGCRGYGARCRGGEFCVARMLQCVVRAVDVSHPACKI